MKRLRTAPRTVALVAAVIGMSSTCDGLHATEGAPDAAPHAAAAQQAVIVVVGAAGADEYQRQFAEWADQWRQAAQSSGAHFTLIGGDDSSSPDVAEEHQDDRSRLQAALASHSADADANARTLWLVLIGHGSFDGATAKFNLRGPDLSAVELKQWLAPLKTPLAIINCASASAPFLNELSGAGRIVITATKSGHELNFARFGQYLAASIDDPRADLDKDGQTSLLEAYLTACRDVEEFYASEQRLATEHALLDDNGDALGTPAAWFRGIRATQRTQEGASLDGLRAHQLHLTPSDREARMPLEARRRRDELELALADLRDRKEKLDEAAYYAELEPLLVELARLYASVEQADAIPSSNAPPATAP